MRLIQRRAQISTPVPYIREQKSNSGDLTKSIVKNKIRLLLFLSLTYTILLQLDECISRLVKQWIWQKQNVPV